MKMKPMMKMPKGGMSKMMAKPKAKKKAKKRGY